MKRLMITAMHSGAGKTTVTCGLLALLQRRGWDVRSYKCGPDYIDPMFHSRVLGIPSRSLDLFLQGPAAMARTLSRDPGEIQVLEGAMGYYDGIGGDTRNSAWDIACQTDTPAVLVLRPKGQSATLAAQLQGLLSFRPHSSIAAVIFTDTTPMLYAHLAAILRRETSVPVLGYLPPMPDAAFSSRHLGLVTAQEIPDFQARISAIARQMEQTVDLETLLALSERNAAPDSAPAQRMAPRCRIAVARDPAFCFYYQDSLNALEEAGAELVYFSPLHDTDLPEHIHGLYLGGGYPELYAQALSQNTAMRTRIGQLVRMGMPTVAECGGFLYLQELLEDEDAGVFPMAGALPGRSFQTPRLQRFGYLTLTAQKTSMLFRPGERVPAHEFHHWDSTENGGDLLAEKPTGRKSWRCGVTGPSLYAGFPHLHLGGELPLARRFVDAAAQYKKGTP